MGFYKTALIGFTVHLILLLGIMAYILSNKDNNQQFPATLSTCPDFYSLNQDGQCIMDTSVYASRDQNCLKLNPRDLAFNDKKLWAVGCGVSWDGITNNSSI